MPSGRVHPRRCAAALVAMLGVCACAPAGKESATGVTSPAGHDAIEAPGKSSLATGLQLYRQGDLKGAEPHLVGALKEAPRDRRILETLGAIYGRTDRFRQAEESFRAALAADPTSVPAQLGLAAVFVDTGRYEEAGKALGDVLRRDPGNLTARLKGALLDVRLGRTAQAEAGAREVIARQPDNAEAHYVLGLALERKGALEEAVREMLRVHELSSAHLGALSHLVTLETQRGRVSEALRWRKAQQESLSRAHIEERVRDHRIKGVAAFNREDYTAALQEFQAIAREDPNDPQVHLHLGSALIALGRLDEAKGEIERCLSLEPRNERALAELGRMHALANRLDEAVAALKKAVAINPDFAEPHYYLAGIHMARGEQDLYKQEMTIFQELQSRSRGSALEVQPPGKP